MLIHFFDIMKVAWTMMITIFRRYPNMRSRFFNRRKFRDL